jgi:phosphatidate cytidylyltransferase
MKNVIIRGISGIVFLAVMIACLLGGPVSYACLMLVLLMGMMYEFYSMTLGGKKWLQKIIGITAGAAWFMAFFFLNEGQYSFFRSASLFVLVFVLWIALFIQQLYRQDEQPFQTIATTLLVFMYIALPWSLMNFLAYNFTSTYKGTLLLSLFAILWCSDVGAYVFGMLFGQHGKHKLFPRISPKKSWEGFTGGLLWAVGAGYVLTMFGFPVADMMISAILIAVFGVFGDLIESMLKRSVGLKDSGKIMPGHGGLLDRFDAALIAFPIVWLYLLLISIL